MFWGPAIHWNTYLRTYVMLLNHAIDTKLTQDGIFISFSHDVGNPAGWTKPQMILNRQEIQKAMAGAQASPTKLENGWYPEVIGTEKGETDKVVGRTARFFLAGIRGRPLLSYAREKRRLNHAHEPPSFSESSRQPPVTPSHRRETCRQRTRYRSRPNRSRRPVIWRHCGWLARFPSPTTVGK